MRCVIVRRGSSSHRLLETAVALIICGSAAYALISVVAQSPLHAQSGGVAPAAPTAGNWHAGASLSRTWRFVTVSDDDNGETIALRPGQALQIELATNPTGCSPPHPKPRVIGPGCMWKVANVDGSVLSMSGGSVGYAGQHAPGRQTFQFTPQKRGTTVLKLAYVRLWDKGAPPIETYELTVSTDVTSP